MKVDEDLQRVLSSFKQYYNIKTDEVTKPFAAEAEFHSHNEQYVLVKAAKIADIDSNEYVFFAATEKLTLSDLLTLDQKAWEEGLSRVNPSCGHRNSDISLIIITQAIDEDAKKQIKKLKHYKSYKFGFYGWSQYRLIAYDLSENKAWCNRTGSILKKLVCKK